MPLGPSGLAEVRTSEQIRPGVTYYQITRGQAAATDFWTVTVEFAKDQASAAPAVAAMTALGLQVRFDSAGLAPDGSQLGFNVSVGQFTTQAAAQAEATSIAAATQNAFVPTVRSTALDGNPASTGPWIVNITAISPSFKGNLQNIIAGANSSAAGGILGLGGETPQATVGRLGGIVGINAGYWSTNDNAAGDELKGPAGAIVSDGNLEGMSATGEAGVTFMQVNGHPTVSFLSNLSSVVTVTNSQGASASVTGINSAILGQHFSCGSPGAAPSAVRAHDFTCVNDNDLVLYDGNFASGRTSGVTVDPGYKGDTFEVLVDATGKVLSAGATLGAPVPAGGYVLQALGTSVTWLQQNAPVGTMLSVKKQELSGTNPVALAPGMSLAAAGPELLPAASVIQRSAADGFNPTFAGIDRSSFYWGFVNARNPRTMIGVAPDGTILLAETDGRQPGLAIGTSMQETAALMQWMGAVNALNLDGGGSSAMVVNGIDVGHPSDNTPANPTQRAVATSIVLTGS
ncbi:phosphodiester glycosidase family protein [Paraburkholderia sp. SARCC-3016]|uniref:phosphodiester glycosidase family protein n=1 Tax=Paraburkholderia sp. SARCC-3016 TaxID=3058611 RepID=UPI002807D144|nr:phosphodiester glycosidase family protein [Paraburkholderia sp. SARCC-3016]MDQ7981610.1 phosphodiester glycosidase family protein [Paraburkholderia sp. SARCC-3016]